MSKVKEWITINGRHIPIMDGQSRDEAIKDRYIKYNKAEANRLNGKTSDNSVKAVKPALIKRAEKDLDKYGSKYPDDKEYQEIFKKRRESLQKLKDMEVGDDIESQAKWVVEASKYFTGGYGNQDKWGKEHDRQVKYIADIAGYTERTMDWKSSEPYKKMPDNELKKIIAYQKKYYPTLATFAAAELLTRGYIFNGSGWKKKK